MTAFGDWLYRWLFTDFWVPTWPNLAAGVVVAAWVSLKARSVKALHAEIAAMHVRHHADLMAALSHDAPGGIAAEVRKAREDFADVLSTLNALHAADTPAPRRAKTLATEPAKEAGT